MKCCINLFYMYYLIYFFQQSSHALGGGNRYASFQSDFMALRFKLKRANQKHNTAQTVVITSEIVSSTKKQWILSKDKLCL